MNRTQMCVANVQYKRAGEGGRQRGLLRYLTYREGRFGPELQEVGEDRWVDHGLGHTLAEINRYLDDYRSRHVLAFNLVLNVNPELIALVPVQQREAFVRELTERTVEQYFQARGLDGGVEYSYVLHHRESQSLEAPGLHDPHTHIVLPGTFFDEGKGDREPLYFSRNAQENHIELLHRITEREVTQEMDRYVGRDWERRIDELEIAREQERQRIIERTPEGMFIDDHNRGWQVWTGVRQTTEDRSAAGYYRYYPRDPESDQRQFSLDEVQLEFRPLVRDLPHHSAQSLAHVMGRDLRAREDPRLERLQEFAQQFTETAREWERERDQERHLDRGPSLSISF